jgi:hypothetical protein
MELAVTVALCTPRQELNFLFWKAIARIWDYFVHAFQNRKLSGDKCKKA